MLCLIAIAAAFVGTPTTTTLGPSASSPYLDVFQWLSLVASIVIMIFACVLTLEPHFGEAAAGYDEGYWSDEEEFEDD